MSNIELEQELCRLCQFRFQVPKVLPTDDFIKFGGDSLTILGFLVDAAELMPNVELSSLIGTSTVRELLELNSGIKSPSLQQRIRIRPVDDTDCPAVTVLLDEGFRRTLPWQRLFTHPWQAADVPRGFVLTDSDDIVGFVGLICTERTLNSKIGLVGNLSSWYVRKPYRGRSNALLAAATEAHLSYTSLTPSRTSERLLQAIGFEPLDQVRSLAVPYYRPLHRPAPIVICHVPDMYPRLDTLQQRIVRDHEQYGCLAVLLIDGAQQELYLFSRRRFQSHGITFWPYSQLLFASGTELFQRHLQRLTRLATRRQHTVGITFDQRAGHVRGGVPFRAHTLVRPFSFHPADLDKLYSELVLLPV